MRPKSLKMMMMMMMMSFCQQILPFQAKECSMYKINHTITVCYCVTILMLWVTILHAFKPNWSKVIFITALQHCSGKLQSSYIFLLFVI
jgi:hypothetical protein